MPADNKIEHGTRKALQQHRDEGTTPCVPCYNADADYHMAWRIRHTNKNLAVPLGSMRRILAGEDPNVVLAETFGPLTLAAVREHPLIEGTVPRD